MKKSFLFFLLSLYSISCFSQYKLLLHYEQASVETKELLQKVKIKKSYPSTNAIEKELNKIYRLFQRNYYSAFSIDTIVQDSFTLTAHLFFGEPLIINDIKVEGLEENIVKTIKKPASPFGLEDVVNYAEKIVKHLENNGFPFATAGISHFEKDSSRTNAVLIIEKNNRILWDSIIVKGNAKISKSFLYGYFNIKPGKIYKESTVKQLPDKIQSLTFVEELQPASVSFGEKEAVLYLYLNKRKINQFDGYIGIVPENNQSGKTLITGNINLLLNNIMTLGERIALQWKNPNKLSQNLDMEFSFPFLFGSPFGLDVDFHLLKKDTSYLNINFLPGIQYFFKGNNYLKFYYHYNSSRLIAAKHLADNLTLPENIDYKSHLYRVKIHYQRLDYVFNPRKGFSFSTAAAIGKRTIIKNNFIPTALYDSIDLSSLRLASQIDFSCYIPIKKKWTWLIRLQGAGMYSKNLFVNELYRLGGMKTLRGFIEQSMYASSYAIVNTEIRFLFSKNSFLNAFFDAGWYEQKLEQSYLHDFPFGFGAGINFDTKAGIFSLSYALGKQMDNPIQLKTGTISFGYIAMF